MLHDHVAAINTAFDGSVSSFLGAEAGKDEGQTSDSEEASASSCKRLCEH